MKKLLTILLISLTSICAFAQNKVKSSESFPMTETDSLYLIAVKKYIIEIDSFYSQYSQQESQKTIFIEYQDYLFKLPDSINGYNIQKIGLGNRKKIFRKHKNELTLVKISPLTISGGNFKITLIPYSATLKRNHLYLGISDWTEVFFEFKNGRLNYVKTENGGI